MMRTADAAKSMMEDEQPRPPPPHGAPDPLPPPWLTIADIGKDPNYRRGLPPVTTGFVGLDSALRGGFRPECMYVLAGRTGSAKTTLGLNIGRRAAQVGINTLVFKLEESPLETMWRMHAAASSVPLIHLLDGTPQNEPERQALADGFQLLRGLPLRISNERDIDDIERVTAQHVIQRGQLVIIDQLSMIRVGDAEVGFAQATEASNRLRLVAVSHRIPILLIAQVNRAAARDTEERLTCHDLRDSGCIENDAAGVILINNARDAAGPSPWKLPRTLEILIAKNRYGPITKADDTPVELHWYPAICRVEDLSFEVAESDGASA